MFAFQDIHSFKNNERLRRTHKQNDGNHTKRCDSPAIIQNEVQQSHKDVASHRKLYKGITSFSLMPNASTWISEKLGHHADLASTSTIDSISSTPTIPSNRSSISTSQGVNTSPIAQISISPVFPEFPLLNEQSHLNLESDIITSNPDNITYGTISPNVKFTTYEYDNDTPQDNPFPPNVDFNNLTYLPNPKHVSLQDFQLLKVIGKGSYGKVMMVINKHDQQVYAMKMLRKDNILKCNQVEHTKTERYVLQTVDHPFIVQLHRAFQTPKKLYFVMEYCPGGELFFHLSRAGRFNEARARFYAAQIVLALEHLHKQHVIYRDLKPENILLDKDGYIRITDFGLSKRGIRDNFSAKSLCGTPEYLAPEILNQSGHGKAVDWWSLGALIYEMLTGLPPFYTRDREKLFQSIRSGELRYPSFVSANAKSIMMGLFQRDPVDRLGSGPTSAQEIKGHLWFATVDWYAIYEKTITPSFRPDITSPTDVTYFDKNFTRMPIKNSEVNDPASILIKDEMFEGFTYDPWSLISPI